MEPIEFEEENEEDEENEEEAENEENEEEYAMEVIERVRDAVSAGSSLDEAMAGIDNPALASVVSSQLYGCGDDEEEDEPEEEDELDEEDEPVPLELPPPDELEDEELEEELDELFFGVAEASLDSTLVPTLFTAATL